jgi:hypothetical protein
MPTVSTMPGDARQRQRGLQHGQQRDDQHQVGQQREIGDQAEHAVVERHEQHHQHEADNDRLHAAVDVLLAEARADGALLDLEDRRRQRAGAQQQGEVAGLEGLEAGDHEAVGEHAADGRHAD